jgi:DNA-directed RNA polymerase alpha subunit
MIQTRDIGRMQKLHDDPLCGSVAERNRLLRDASSEIVALRAEIARLCKEVERLTELVGNACKFNPSEIPNGCDDDTDGLHEFMSFLTSTHLDSVETTWRVRKAAQYLGAETVEELSQFRIEDILAIKNTGAHTVLDVGILLHRHGLRLRESVFPNARSKEIRRLQCRIGEWMKDEVQG